MKRVLLSLCLLLAGLLLAPTARAQCPGNGCAKLPSGYLSTAGNQITDGLGNNVRMACVQYRDGSVAAPTSMPLIRAAGFNCVRIPWRDAYQVTPPAADDCSGNTRMDACVLAAGNAGLKVIFDHQGNEAPPLATSLCFSRQQNGLWYDLNNSTPPYNVSGNTDGCGNAGTITYGTFKNNTVAIATRYAGNTTVIGMDLHNEPFTFSTVTGAAAVSWGNTSAPPPPPPTTFADEFTTLSLHDRWQTGDNWGLIVTTTPAGRGGAIFNEGGTQWWINPFEANTPVAGGTAPAPMYQISPSGTLQLELTNTPTAIRSFINTASGSTLPFIGALLNTQNTNLQLRGYWQFSVAVDRVPGLTFQMDLEDYPPTFTSEIDFDVWTDAAGVQHIMFAQDGITDGHQVYTTSSASGFDPSIQHIYGIDWEAATITFYVDGTQVGQANTPTDGSYNNPMFAYLLTGANYSANGQATVNPASTSLPAYAHVNCFEVYTSNPGSYKCHK